MTAKPRFFATPAAFRRWLEKNHGKAKELWVGFHKVHTSKPSITWPQSVDAALCFGWIDGLRKGLGEDAYVIRFSPRRAQSIWSAVNIRRVAELREQGLMSQAGLAAFGRLDPKRTRVYSFENRNAAFDEETAKAFRSKKKAWAFFETQPPGYRRVATHWVMSAKRAETRQRRVADLIALSGKGERHPLFAKAPVKSGK
jgi:uncharacterized protein YdeI (YjbR/CyaY-like superfamily)